ncbi:MAG TPA: nitroreductase family protein [Acidobacteriota bacterium]|nr:nitroreductase family protein [Acidobacteriota bacterium]
MEKPEIIRGQAIREYRQPEKEIESMLLERWSPRSFNGQAVGQDDLERVFEAARWAPSSYNEQPWRFLYAHRDGPHWEQFFSFMGEFNQKWAANAGVLIVVVSKKTFKRNDKPNRCHSFDTGSAWQNLALQATQMGLAAHGMAGFDHNRTARELGVPDNCRVECMIALGHPAPAQELPDDLRKKEEPSGRNPVAEFVCEGRWDF